MKKLNNKGFAISSILYSIMVLFLMLLLSILGILGSRKATLDRTKKDILDELNSNYLSNRFVFVHRNITVVNSGNKDDIVYALMDGVSALDENGNPIPKENISYDLDIDTIENRDYVVTYTATNNQKTIIGTRTITFTDMQTVNTYSYTGNVQTFNPKYDGNYKIELWGSQSNTGEKTNGNYTRGNILLSTVNTLHVYVGSQTNTFNTGNIINAESTKTNIGGNTDIRLEDGNWNDFNSLKSRIMLAPSGGTIEEAYISGYDGCNSISQESTESNITYTDQSIHYSGYKFNNAVNYNSNEEMPNHNGTGKITGNTGNGFAKISLIYYY